MKRLVTLALTLILGLAWAGPESNSLVIGSSQEPEFFNVWTNPQQTTTNIVKMIFVGLVYFDAEGALQPGLATEVPTEENGRFEFLDEDGDGAFDATVVRWTIHPDAAWHDGVPVTSADYAFTYQVEAHPLIPSSKGLVQRIRAFNVIDDSNFEIVYDGIQPFVTQPGQTGIIQNVEAQPKHIWQPIFDAAIAEAEALGDDAEARAEAIRSGFIAAPPATSEVGPVVGNGPFEFVEWQPGNFVRLRRSEAFFRNPPDVENYVDEIVVRFIENTPTLQVNVINGDVDATTTPGLGLDEGIVLQRFAEAAGFSVIVPAGDKWERLHLNLFDIETTRDLQLDDARTRIAIAHALDRQGLVDTLFAGTVRVGHSFILSGDENYKQDIQTYDYDPERASELLAELGWAPGPDGVLQRTADDGRVVRFEFEYKTTAGNATRERIQEFFQSNLGDVGIDVNIDNLPSSPFFSREHFRGASEGAWTGAIQFFSTLVPVRNDGFWLFSDRDNTPTVDNGRSGRNLGGWDNAEFNQLQIEVENTPPGPDRQALLDRMQELYAAELPIVGIYERADPYTIANGLLNYAFSSFETSLTVEPWNWGWEQNGATGQ